MGAIVTADYVIGSKNNLTRAKLKRIIRILNISDPDNKLPVGKSAVYVLTLETTAPTPTMVPVPRSGAKKAKRKRRT